MRFVRGFREVGLGDVGLVGGKNASLGELIANLEPLGVAVPDGFCVTAEAYRDFLTEARLDEPIRRIVSDLRKDDVAALVRGSDRIRELIGAAALPKELMRELEEAYRALSLKYGEEAADVAVRSSATAEDLPTASFAGQQESFLNVRGAIFVADAVRKAFASLFTPRAISYRLDMGFDHMKVALSVGVQKMVRSDLASAGVIFTLDPDTGHREMVLVTSSFGLGESVVQGRVAPDQFYVHKPTLKQGFRPLVWKKLGSKEVRLVYDETGHRQVKTIATSVADRSRFSLSDDDVLTLARWSLQIEEHYSGRHGAPTPMDIEWAKDGVSGKLFVVQARPETVHSRRVSPKVRLYSMETDRDPIVTGLAVGDGVGVGSARVIQDPKRLEEFQPGDVLVTEITDPDWEPIMKSAAAIVTERGGRTSHAAIVARELSIPAVVGAEGAMNLAPRALSEEELKLILQDSHEDGVLTEGEAQIILRAFEFADRPAEAIMVPAAEVDYLSLARTYEENLTIARRNMHARLPLCETGLDSVKGVVGMKDVWLLQSEAANSAFERAARPVTKLRYDLSQELILRRLQETRSQLAVVRDAKDIRI
jgi:pyruvate,water dikinase